MIRDFDKLPILDIQKPRVGIVGEILVKFAPAANNHLVELLESEGAEAVVPDLLDFFLYCFYNANFKAEKLGMSKSSARKCNLGIKALEWLRSAARDEFEKSSRFTPPAHIEELARYARSDRFRRKPDRRRLVLNRRNVRTDPHRNPKYCLHTAICLSAKPYRWKGCYQRAAPPASGSKYRCDRLRSGCIRGKPAQPY